MAKYNDIARELRQRIRSGEYVPLQPIPSQKQLASQFKTSRMTMQKALDALTSEGLIHGKRGLGTFVSAEATQIVQSEISIDQYGGSTEGKDIHRKFSSQTIEFQIEYPETEIRTALQLDKNELVYKIIRLQLIDQAPAAIEHTYMPVNVIPGITKDVLNHSIYHYIKHNLNLKTGPAFRQISAEKPDQLDLKYLKCTPSDPILQIKQTVYLSDQRPFEYSRTRNRYGLTKITAFVNSNDN